MLEQYNKLRDQWLNIQFNGIDMAECGGGEHPNDAQKRIEAEMKRIEQLLWPKH